MSAPVFSLVYSAILFVVSVQEKYTTRLFPCSTLPGSGVSDGVGVSDSDGGIVSSGTGVSVDGGVGSSGFGVTGIVPVGLVVFDKSRLLIHFSISALELLPENLCPAIHAALPLVTV